MKPSDRIILEKIRDYCDDGASIVEQCSCDPQFFSEHFVYQYAGSMCIMQIGELVTRLSDDVIANTPQIPWKLIRGARNIHAHDYDRVRPETVWESLIGDFPTLKEQIQSLLDTAND